MKMPVLSETIFGSIPICFFNHRGTEFTEKHRDCLRATWCRCVSVV